MELNWKQRPYTEVSSIPETGQFLFLPEGLIAVYLIVQVLPFLIPIPLS